MTQAVIVLIIIKTINIENQFITDNFFIHLDNNLLNTTCSLSLSERVRLNIDHSF